ncbi:SLAP domain-containing protein [Companilactobacillus farciminis]|nr:SLAP domain-containing protein [Companilactobacillus farciminis]
MKKINKIFLYASLLALTSGIAAVPTVTRADISYGLTNVGSAIVTTKDEAQLYNDSGQPLGRYLPAGSEWKTSLENTLDSGSYYGVGAHEFLKSSDVDFESLDGKTAYSQGQVSAVNYAGIQVTSTSAPLYDESGQPLGRSLPEGSNWKVDVQDNNSKGTFYRVATGEYVSAVDVRPYQDSPIYSESKVVTTPNGAPTRLYDEHGQLISSRALAPNTSWYTDQFTDIGGIGFYRVATDEYVMAYQVD